MFFLNANRIKKEVASIKMSMEYHVFTQKETMEKAFKAWLFFVKTHMKAQKSSETSQVVEDQGARS